MHSEFLIEVKLNEESDKITQTMTGANNTQMKPTAYDEYINASKGKTQKGKGKGTEGKQDDAQYVELPSIVRHNADIL